MIQIQLSNIALVLGAKRIFENLSWEIQQGQKIGLIGANGAGKSSLFKLITGEYQAELGGVLTRARGISVGYLSQIPELNPEQTALNASLSGNPRIAEILLELDSVEASLGNPAVYQNENKLSRTLEKQQQLLEEYQLLGGDGYPKLVKDTLLGLGLPEADLHKPIAVLSGGQKKLIGLARLLMLKPDVLLLDEPDNHLDMLGKTYLEKLIREYSGTVVLISHDRYLLDAVVTHIAELEDGKINLFAGDYSDYQIDKEARLARQQELYTAQQHQVERLEASIKRLLIWGRVYDNEKFITRAKSMQKRLEKMDQIEKPVSNRRQMDLNLSGWRGSNKVLELINLNKSFEDKVIYQNINHTLWHGERVGLIGPNGAGKSVFVRMLLNQEMPDSGEIRMGPSVTLGHYAQEHETLDLNKTALEMVCYAGNMSESKATAFLIHYLFSYKQISQKIADFSGGERSRLQLALLVLSGANFLLLDEPTNNLDIASAEVLEQSLKEFVGTALIISHDRYFLDRTVQRIWSIENGFLKEYVGGYSDFLEKSKH